MSKFSTKKGKAIQREPGTNYNRNFDLLSGKLIFCSFSLSGFQGLTDILQAIKNLFRPILEPNILKLVFVFRYPI